MARGGGIRREKRGKTIERGWRRLNRHLRENHSIDY